MSLAIAQDLMSQYISGVLYSQVEGFEYLGCGVSRYAYRSHKDGMVYKVGNHTANMTEMEAAAWFKSHYPLPGILWPTFKVWDEVRAGAISVSETVYLPKNSVGSNHPSLRSFLRLLANNGITDNHTGNVYEYRGLMVCIDFGYWAKDAAPQSPCTCDACRRESNW